MRAVCVLCVLALVAGSGRAEAQQSGRPETGGEFGNLYSARPFYLNIDEASREAILARERDGEQDWFFLVSPSVIFSSVSANVAGVASYGATEFTGVYINNDLTDSRQHLGYAQAKFNLGQGGPLPVAPMVEVTFGEDFNTTTTVGAAVEFPVGVPGLDLTANAGVSFTDDPAKNVVESQFDGGIAVKYSYGLFKVAADIYFGEPKKPSFSQVLKFKLPFSFPNSTSQVKITFKSTLEEAVDEYKTSTTVAYVVSWS